MRTLRRISQVVFILVFYVLFLMASYPLASRIPVNFFLKLDPLVSVSAAMAARSLAVIALPAIILIVLTIVLGRFFCGWICRLGATVDGTDTMLGAHKKKMVHLKYKWIKILILIAVLLAALASVQLSGIVDSYRSTICGVNGAVDGECGAGE